MPKKARKKISIGQFKADPEAENDGKKESGVLFNADDSGELLPKTSSMICTAAGSTQ